MKDSDVKNYRMSRIRSKNTKFELQVFEALEKNKIAFVKHDTSLPGKPDAVIKDKKIVLFVDSDFWHGWKLKDWSHKLKPYWLEKIQKNIKRDRKNNKKLKLMGWKVVRLREKVIKTNLSKAISKIEKLGNNIKAIK